MLRSRFNECATDYGFRKGNGGKHSRCSPVAKPAKAHARMPKGLLDVLVPPSACVRGGKLTIPAFEHLMGGIMCGLAAFLTHTVSPKFVYMSFFVSFMLLQCAVTGFSPPRLMGTYVLGLKRD